MIATGYIPKSVRYVGKVKNVVKYTDKLGEHLVIATETGATASKVDKDFDGKDAAMIYHI